MHHLSPRALTALPAGPLRGRLRVPGDRSISHGALLFGALASGRTRISGLLEAGDVLSMAGAVTALGAAARRVDQDWEVMGRGVGGLARPEAPLDFAGSGTAVRLMMGVIAGHDMTVTLTGDASLSTRPMAHVLQPLRQMGLEVLEAGRERLPLTIRGPARPVPIVYRLPFASAQVKSAILIAGLAAPGKTTVIEPEPTRDHTERLLRRFGAEVGVVEQPGGGRAVTVTGDAELTGTRISVPGDPSAAAFLTAAALIVPGSEIVIEGALVNATRTGFYATLMEMGADIALLDAREAGGEPVADIRVRYSRLAGVRVPPARALSMIEAYPILAVVAACAAGDTRMPGLAGLAARQSDRLAAIAAGLAANGVDAEIEGDTLIVHGGSGSVRGGGSVATHMDHRIAMAFLTLGFAAEAPITVDDCSFMATSIPEFQRLMEGLGARFSA